MRGRKDDLSNGTKHCAKCDETKPLEAFGRAKYTTSGVSVYCKACMAANARAYRATPEGKATHRQSTENWIAKAAGTAPAVGSKTCPKCSTEKPLEQFPKNRRTKTGTGSYCLTCSAEMVRARRETPEGLQAHRAASKRWREANLERHADNSARWNYGVERGTYSALLAKQNGNCAICQTPENGMRHAIDHDHATGEVRGLLCTNCNNGLGRFKDRADLLISAAKYLTERRAESGG